jgi:mono/diheme cytochrome c family protein
MTRKVNFGAAAFVVALFFTEATIATDDSLVTQGEYLAHAAGCVTCHTEDIDGALPLAGGRALKSPFGTFYSPNITPDVATGIGAWTDDDFVTALWEGKNPEGDHYFPAFPYTAYTGMTRADALAIKAYLFSLDAVRNHNPEHDLPFYMSSRMAAGGWKLSYFDAGRFVPDHAKSEQWNRGAYLVRHLGHCGECHTPRGRLGALQEDAELAGNPEFSADESVPNITPHKENGIGRWSASDIEYFLDIGMLPDGDFSGGEMGAVIEDSTSRMTREDRMAIATYLKSLPAIADP